jgi:hypothetical protein
MTDELIRNIPKDRLAEVWCSLNRAERHELVSDWPANWSDMDRTAKHGFVWPVMEQIMHAIGYKECIREWNKDSMTPEEFESWYRGTRR